MNRKMTTYILGRMLGVEAAVLMIPALVSVIYREDGWKSFLITSAILAFLYLIFGRKKPEDSTIYGRDGFIIIASAWILWSVFGSIPFWISGAIPSYVDALFETISGFTTTGSTILNNIDSLPYGMNFWRCLTHWIGGMGVLVFVLVIVSLEDKNTMHLMRAEVPGPETDKLVPKARDTAKILYGMYLSLTVIEIIFLLLGGMNLYDSVIHAFSTAGTGGFNNHQDSVMYYNSAYIEGVLTVFMILFGINFNMYYLILLKKAKDVFRNEELRAYLGIIIGAATLITVNIANMFDSIVEAFRYAIFQVASIITTTGFSSYDFDTWPQFSKTIILAVMMIGACAGSTGGGIKISRILILLKSIKIEIRRLIHPKSVNIVKVNGKKIKEDTIRGVSVYFAVYVTIFVVSLLLISLDKFDFTTNFTGVLTTMSNVGPGLSKLGPAYTFSQFSDVSKIVFCLNMLIGRLEIFPFLLLFSPSLWRRKF